MLLRKFSARWEAGTTYVDLYRLKGKLGNLFIRARVGVRLCKNIIQKIKS